MYSNNFGRLIASHRHSLGLTQAELASKIHVTSKAVSRWECGRGFPEFTLLAPLANALKLDVAVLVGAVEECQTPPGDSACRIPDPATGVSSIESEHSAESQQSEDMRERHLLQKLPLFEAVMAICMLAVRVAAMDNQPISNGDMVFCPLIWSWCVVFGRPLLLFCVGRSATRYIVRIGGHADILPLASIFPELLSLLMLVLVAIGLAINLIPLVVPEMPGVLAFTVSAISLCPMGIWVVLGILQGLS